MRRWEDLQEPDKNEMLLNSALTLLCEIHSRRMSDEARRHWIRRLLPLAGSALFRALEAACDDRNHFTLAWVIETAASESRRDTKPFAPLPQLTESERHAADLAAVKSLLWLHYAHGWDLERVGAEVIGGVFARSRGMDPADVPAILEAARASYPSETILRWMDQQSGALS